MKKLFWLYLFISIFFSACGKKSPVVLIKTELGQIKVEIYEKQAPVTAVNFLRYMDENRYPNSSFYRVVTADNQTNPVKIELIQGELEFQKSDLNLLPIEHETTKITGIRHTNGAISMARDKPGTASSEFSICIGYQPGLDFGNPWQLILTHGT